MKPLAALFALLLTANVAAADLVVESPKRLPAVRDAHLTELLAQREGSPVIVSFWASWCEPCRDEMPALQRLADRGISVITVAVADNKRQVGDFLDKISVTLPLAYDPDQVIARAWGVSMLPSAIVLNRHHRIVARGRGAINWDAAPKEKQLELLFK